MRSLIILSLLAVASCALSVQGGGPVLTRAFVDELNSLPNMTWRAAYSNGRRVTNADMVTLQRLMGVKKRRSDGGGDRTLPHRVFTKEELQKPLPASFDSAEHWPHCKTIPTIRDQSNCGSCWAVAAASTASDRMCTTGDYTDLALSADNVLSCCGVCGQGCGGGQPEMAWGYWATVGFFSEQCQPYPFPPCEHHGAHGQYPPCGKNIFPTPECHDTTCTSNGTSSSDPKPTLYTGKTRYSLSGEEEFMRELMLHGPIEIVFTVYSDFVTYVSGVYQHRQGDYIGLHAVRLVGWGVDKTSGVKYWKVANSWNTDWGMKGYFLIRRGVDECGIEDEGVAGSAK